MRFPWRLLHLRPHLQSHLRVASSSSHFHVLSDPNLQSLRSVSSLLHGNPARGYVSPPISDSHFASIMRSGFGAARTFSSEPAVEQKESDPAVVADIFCKSTDADEIRKDLESNGVVFSLDLVFEVLAKLESKPDVAVRFFDWVSGNCGEKVGSQSYNLMLEILGLNGLVKEFWDLNGDMKKKGFSMCGGTRDRVLEKFEKDGLESEAEKLRDAFASGVESIERSPERIALIFSRLIRNKVWGDDLEQQLRDRNVTFSSDVVKMILENLAGVPAKALIFFRWVSESGLFKHNEQTYNAMAKVLGWQDYIDRFWKVVAEMRSHGYEIEVVTISKVLGRFCKRGMIEEAVNLYELAMAGSNKPSVDCVTFLLKKIAVSKDFDLSLFSRTLKAFTEAGNAVTHSMAHAVLNSLSAVGRIGEHAQVLNAMKEYGYVVNGNLKAKVAYKLSRKGKSDEAHDFVMDNKEASGCNPDNNTWVSLIKGHCEAGDVDKASDCIHKMDETEGMKAYALDLIVNAFCREKRETDAYSLLCNLVDKKQLRPKRSSYKTLISNLLVLGEFRKALKLLRLMRDQSFPLLIDPFIPCVSESGTVDDTIVFLKLVTRKRSPSSSLYLRVFEAFFKAGRHSDAQDVLAKCPRYIRNHVDVLNLFSSMKPAEDAAPQTLAT